MTDILVKAGTLVTFEGVGVSVRADLNDPEFGRQPYVTISTDDLAPEHRYDEKTGLCGDTDTPPFSFHEDGACGLVKRDGEIISRHFPYERSSWDTHRAAMTETERLNAEWRERAGTPIIAVHLNDCTVFDDEGAGPRHLSDMPKTDRFRAMEAALEAIRASVEDQASELVDTYRVVCDQLHELGISV